MKKKFYLFLLKVFAKIRGWLNPLKLPKDWEGFKKDIGGMEIYDFEKYVMLKEYRPDLLGGFLDRTASWEHFIDETVKYGRDCDDFAAAWRLWFLANGYNVITLIVTTLDQPFRRSHVVCISEKDDIFQLVNYTREMPQPSLQEALADLHHASDPDKQIVAIQDVYGYDRLRYGDKIRKLKGYRI